MATHSSTLAWQIPWMEEPGRLQSMGSLGVRHDWATSLSLFTFHFYALEKEMATHSSVLAWRILGPAEPGGLPCMGSHRIGHDWSDLAAAAAAAEVLYSQQKTRLGADYGTDHELLIAKFRLKLKKVGKTTRPFRYDLNQISYDYTVKVRNRFKELDLIECLKSYVWRFVTLYRSQGSRPSPRKRHGKRQNGCLRRP